MAERHTQVRISQIKGIISNKIEQNIMLNAFRIAINGGLTQFDMVDGIIDEFEDESGVDTGASTNEDYDSSNDLYEPGTESGGIDSNTKLLLHSNGVDASKSHPITFNGNAQLDTAQYKFDVSSCLFDGTGDYLSIPDHADWNFGGGDFTVDFWMRLNSLPTSPGDIYTIWSQYVSSSPATWLVIAMEKSGADLYLGISSYNNDVYKVDANIKNYGFATNTWYHVAIVKSGSSIKLYINGIDSTTVNPASDDWGDMGVDAWIGARNGGSKYFDGWIDEFRISKGIARWTSDFSGSLPSSEHISDQYTTLLLHFNGSDTATSTDDASGGDESGNNHIVTFNADAQLDTAQSKFGGASTLFDGTGDYLSVPDSDDWNFGSGNFTIDFWVRFNADPADISYMGSSQDNDNNWNLWHDGAGTLKHTVKTGGVLDWNIGFAWNPTTGVWYHVALVRDGNNLMAFVDGTQIGSTADITGKTFPDLTSKIFIGSGATGTEQQWGAPLNGWMDEVRISKGIARWTSGFTPPTSEYSTVGITQNMTLIANTVVAETEADDARIIIFEEDVDSVTVNTDLKAYVSRDGGSTWALVTLSDEGDYETNKRVLTGSVDLTQSGIGSGTNMEYKIESLNNKDLKLHGVGLLWSGE